MKKSLYTKDISNLAKVGRETLRFYERLGLLKKAPKNSSGYREYSIEDLNRIQFVKMAQSVGFTLNEIKNFLNLSKNKKINRNLIKENIESKLDMISVKIEALKNIKKTLGELKSQVNSEETDFIICPILGKISISKGEEI